MLHVDIDVGVNMLIPPKFKSLFTQCHTYIVYYLLGTILGAGFSNQIKTQSKLSFASHECGCMRDYSTK